MAIRPGRARAADAQARLQVLPGGRRRPGRSAFIPAAALLILAVFAAVALQAVLSQDGFRAATLEQQLRDAEEQHSLLRARVAELSSPSRLEREAGKLGMEPPADPIYIRTPPLHASGSEQEEARDFSSKRLVQGGR